VNNGVRTAVLVVSHNTCADLRRCLASLTASGAAPEEIWVGDNASGDETREMLRTEFPDVHTIEFNRNYMYARAVNALWRVADPEWALLLNPDTECDYAALRRLCVHFDRDPDLAAVTPQLRYADGRVQFSCRHLPDAATPWREAVSVLMRRRSHWKMAGFDHRVARDVLQPMFSCIWIRRAAWRRVGELDPAYPLFFNDVDWCARARHAGLRIHFDPDVAVVHHVGGTTRRYPIRRLWHAHRSFARYLWRNRRGFPSASAGVLGVWLTYLVRWPGALLKHQQALRHH